ncbi:MAG: DUF547 domain-containing protein [Alphaproteobacteria bacterium]|nr:MAG: DUF547 domain-containing protein [Alphaproteobacteria bacterium]
MKRLAYILWLCLLAPAPARAFDHGGWDSLLKAHVAALPDSAATRVDYGGMTRDRARLDAYLQALGAVDEKSFDTWPKAERLAFLINAYNAWTVELILRHWPGVASIRDLGSLLRTPWQKRFIPLLGKMRTLDDIEHGMIRAPGAYDEPRIHFAVNCASIGCPPLRREAYTGARLDVQLEEATRAFLADRAYNRLVGDRLYVSRLFKWYREDFARGWRGYDSLAAFLAGYGDALGLDKAALGALRAGTLEIAFLDYDWQLNGIP